MWAQEVTHLFGVKHCIYARCVMNGSNHIEEAESRPFVVCPVCLRKVHDSMRSVRRQNNKRNPARMTCVDLKPLVVSCVGGG